jgi:hypothetical protein
VVKMAETDVTHSEGSIFEPGLFERLPDRQLAPRVAGSLARARVVRDQTAEVLCPLSRQ